MTLEQRLTGNLIHKIILIIFLRSVFKGIFEIYFNDLNDECKKKLMEHLSISAPGEANWDINIKPLAIIHIEL